VTLDPEWKDILITHRRIAGIEIDSAKGGASVAHSHFKPSS
jgi:hypothetical protein